MDYNRNSGSRSSNHTNNTNNTNNSNRIQQNHYHQQMGNPSQINNNIHRTNSTGAQNPNPYGTFNPNIPKKR
jgi:hypothetical protein